MNADRDPRWTPRLPVNAGPPAAPSRTDAARSIVDDLARQWSSRFHGDGYLGGAEHDLAVARVIAAIEAYDDATRRTPRRLWRRFKAWRHDRLVARFCRQSADALIDFADQRFGCALTPEQQAGICRDFAVWIAGPGRFDLLLHEPVRTLHLFLSGWQLTAKEEPEWN